MGLGNGHRFKKENRWENLFDTIYLFNAVKTFLL
jgi:hypothetical protein